MWTVPGAAIGLGCMRFSTERDRDEARAVAALHAAFDAGLTVLDTADAYCWDDSDAHHNERLIARAIASWSGDRSRVVVATKGGLTRPGGRWLPDGRARHLADTCENSLTALGVRQIALYQLHAPDPRTPLATSVRALASLQRDGLVAQIGLCNVTVQQIEEARRIADIAAVQVALGPWNDDNLLSGVAACCAAHGIRLIAYRPLGGVKQVRRALRDPVLGAVGREHGASGADAALAWLADLSPMVLPIPGATRVETVQSIGRAAAMRLTPSQRAQIDARFPSVARIRPTAEPAALAPRPAPAVPRAGEVLLIMGLPGAGKSTLAREYISRGYQRLNRDLSGGSLRELAGGLEQLVAAGHTNLVLDNTYLSRKSRAPVLDAAVRAGLPVRCLWLTTSIEDAQVNAVWRMWSAYGRLLAPEEIREASKRDTAVFGPNVQFRLQRELEPPDAAEGFAAIEQRAFARKRDPAYTGRALMLTCEGVLVRSRSGARTPSAPDDVEIIEECGDAVKRWAAAGWRVLGASWRPGIAEGTDTAEDAAAVFARIQEQLDVPIDVQFCPHGGGPPVCWCRRPLPGLGVAFVQRYQLDPARTVYVGAGSHDAGFARRLGFEYRQARDFCYPAIVPPN